jgi:hypothetical protein
VLLTGVHFLQYPEFWFMRIHVSVVHA